MNKTDVQVTRKGVLAQSSDMKTAISTNSPAPCFFFILKGLGRQEPKSQKTI
jgi:hypothetical protein